MQAQTNIADMVHLIDRPAFCVLDGIIISANQAAQNRLIMPEQPVAPMIADGAEHYDAFSQGILYLTLNISGIHHEASIHTVGPYRIFKLETEKVDPELQTLAVAAQALRNPLSSIKAMMDQLFPELQITDDSPAAEQIARINKRVAQIQRIVCNMSDAARYSTSVPHMETRDVDAVIRELFDQASALCEARGIQLSYTGLSVPAYSLIDSEQLERAIYNIISNALKFTPVGGSIQGTLTRRGNTLYLTIQDSGSGLEHNAAGNVFHRFLREPALEDERHGLGLGMKLIQTCAAAHGGTVIVGSTEGEGLRVTLSLSIRLNNSNLRSPSSRIDYAGERNHGLMELSDSLPHTLYKPKKNR